jgi:hypothetical protein
MSTSTKIVLALSLLLVAACSGETPPTKCSGPWHSFPQPMPDIDGAPPVKQTMVTH